MAVELSSIDNIADLIYMRFAEDMNKMHFLFCYKNGEKHFIFQELQAIPVKRLVYTPSDYTITFCASWCSQENPDSLVIDANKEQVAIWKNLTDRSRPYNGAVNQFGVHSPQWGIANRQTDYQYYYDSKKRQKMGKKFDTFTEVRIENVYSFNLYNWGFEIFSNSINLFAITHKHLFPYSLNDHGTDMSDRQGRAFRRDVVEGMPVNAPIKWTGWSFEITSNPQLENQLISYWRKRDVSDDLYDDFYEEIVETMRKPEDEIPNVGQKKIDIDI